jgi:hypothetical protein
MSGEGVTLADIHQSAKRIDRVIDRQEVANVMALGDGASSLVDFTETFRMIDKAEFRESSNSPNSRLLASTALLDMILSALRAAGAHVTW